MEIVSFEAFVQDLSPEPYEDEEPRPTIASNASGERVGGRAFGVLIDDVGLAPERSEDARLSGPHLSRDRRAARRRGGGRDEQRRHLVERAHPGGPRRPERGRDARPRKVRGALRVQPDDRVRGLPHRPLRGLALDVHSVRQGAIRRRLGRATTGPEVAAVGCWGRSRASPQALGERHAVHGDGVRRHAARPGAADGRGAACPNPGDAGRRASGPARRSARFTGASRCCSSRRASSATRRTAGSARCVALSREANTAVYFLDVRGLTAMPGSGTGSAADPGPGPGGGDGDRTRRSRGRRLRAVRARIDRLGGPGVRHRRLLGSKHERPGGRG